MTFEITAEIDADGLLGISVKYDGGEASLVITEEEARLSRYLIEESVRLGEEEKQLSATTYKGERILKTELDNLSCDSHMVLPVSKVFTSNL